MSVDNKIKYRHLKCFIEVARHQSVSRAAESMRLAQPAVSRYMTELEDIVGFSLVVRSRNGCYLTPAGERFFASVAPSVESIRQAYSLASAKNHTEEIVTIGALPTVSAGFLPQVVKRMREEPLGVTLRVIEGNNAELLEHVRQGKVALVLGRLSKPEMMQGLAFEHLYSEPIECLVRPQNPLAGKSFLTSQEITCHPVVINLLGTVVRAEVDSHLLRRGLSLSGDVIETNSVSFSRQLALLEDRTWIVAKGVANHDIAAGSLTPLKINDWKINGSVGISTNPKLQLSNTLPTLADTIRKEAKLWAKGQNLQD